MNKFIKLFFLFTLISCSNNKEVFWCGDHACVNKAEKESYFKKNMTVEIKKSYKGTSEENSKINEIIQQGRLQKKNVLSNDKTKKLSWKQKRQKIKEEKKLAKKILKLERQKAKDNKKIKKRLLKEEKLRVKNEKKSLKKIKKVTTSEKEIKQEPLLVKKIKENSLSFKDLYKKISERGSIKSFPDINNTQE